MVPVPTNPIFVLERLMLATRAASSASQQQQRGDLVIGDAFVEFSNEGEKSGAKARVVSSVRESREASPPPFAAAMGLDEKMARLQMQVLKTADEAHLTASERQLLFGPPGRSARERELAHSPPYLHSTSIGTSSSSSEAPVLRCRVSMSMSMSMLS